jgi:hypothetical protein
MTEQGHTPKEALAILNHVLKDVEACQEELSCVSCGGVLGRDENGNDTEVEHEEDCRWIALEDALPVVERAINAHDALVKALEDNISTFNLLWHLGGHESGDIEAKWIDDSLKRAQAALALAKGATP